eukprot:SAG31_NODE_480_length_15108_cov_56.073423_11_plen_149_part_00
MSIVALHSIQIAKECIKTTRPWRTGIVVVSQMPATSSHLCQPISICASIQTRLTISLRGAQFIANFRTAHAPRNKPFRKTGIGSLTSHVRLVAELFECVRHDGEIDRQAGGLIRPEQNMLAARVYGISPGPVTAVANTQRQGKESDTV